MRHSVLWAPALTAGLALATSPAFAGDVITINKDKEARHPSIAADEKGGLHVAYVSYEAGAKVPDIFHASSTDGGKTWSPGTNVSKTPGLSCDPRIACGTDGHEVIVWLDTSAGMEKPQIYGAFTTDGGKSWSAAAEVSKTSGKAMDPAVAIGLEGVVHVVWADTTDSDTGPDIWHSVSTDKGATWSRAKNISRTLGDARCPSVTCGTKNDVYVCWSDKLGESATKDIFFTTSRDGGKTFTRSTNVSHTPGDSTDPEIAIDDEGVYIVWSDTSTRSKQRDIFLTASRNGGETWEKYVDVAPTPGNSTEPAIYSGDGHLVVVWRDTTGHESSPAIWMAFSTDHGKSWSDPKDISSTNGCAKHPDVVVASGQIHAIWEEYEKGLHHVRTRSLPPARR